MRFARENKEKILKLHNEGCSSYEIAEQFDTYSTKILRALKFLGAEKRSYSDAQKLAMAKGRSKPPIEKGSKLSEQHKYRVSEWRAKSWSETSDEERARLSEVGKQHWQSREILFRQIISLKLICLFQILRQRLKLMDRHISYLSGEKKNFKNIKSQTL